MRNKIRPLVKRTLLPVAIGVIGGFSHISPILFETSLGTPSPIMAYAGLIGMITFLAFIFRYWVACKSPLQATILGTLTGVGYFGTSAYWLGEAVVPEGIFYTPRAALTAFGGWMLLFPWWGLAFGASAATCQLTQLSKKTVRAAIIFSITFAAFDLMLGDFIFRIPLAPIGTSFLDTAFESILAGLGIHGATALIVLTTCILAAGIRRPISGMIAIIPLLGISLASSLYGPGEISQDILYQKRPEVYLIQPSSPAPTAFAQLNLEGQTPEQFIFGAIIGQIRQNPGSDIIVLPELSIPYDLSENPEMVTELAETLTKGQTLIAGFRRVLVVNDPNGSFGFEVKSYNSAIAITSHGEVTLQYDKAHLVPFGEYMPELLHDLGFNLVAGSPTSLEAGAGLDVFKNPEYLPFSILICYESLLSGSFSRETDGAQWAINMSSERQFGKTVGPRLILRYTRTRAYETGVPILRSTANGLTATIDARGAITDILGHNEVGGLEVTVPPSALTFFRKAGYTPLYTALVILLLTTLGSTIVLRRL